MSVEEDARRFVRYCKASKRAWERGNNSGTDAGMAAGNAVEQSKASKAEAIAARYGCRCDWPGLMPVLERGTKEAGNLWEEYNTSDARRVARFFTEATNHATR